MLRWIGSLRSQLSPRISFRCFASTRQTNSDYSHAIIGAGVVGLAVGAELAKEPSNRVLIIEKNSTYGSETSSRNSEVIHAGLYYPEDSLKTQLCVSGKELIYKEAAPNGVEVVQCGKWIVAQDEQQAEYLERLHSKAKLLDIPTEMISVERAKRLEPAVKVQTAVLNSPTTGILSAHSLMDYYISVFQENINSDLVLGTQVIGLNYDSASDNYQIHVETEDTEEGASGDDANSSITVDSVINSAGLHAASISNLLLPEKRHLKQYYAKGNYFSYNSSAIKVNRLIYPSPTPGVKSLGTHLTIDLGGQIKFGPDLEWVDSFDDLAVNASNLEAAYHEVTKYLPGVKLEDMAPIMAGIRPKLIGPSDNSFQDFVIREEIDFPRFINLLGIESPGLTSSFAIAKYVRKLLE